jgi:hypothetical protein
MNQTATQTVAIRSSAFYIRLILVLLGVTLLVLLGFKLFSRKPAENAAMATVETEAKPAEKKDSLPVESKELFDRNIVHMVNGDTSGHWPVKTDYPLAGAILPYKRIVSYYGNLYSKQMGILGELPPAQMLAKLQQEVANWEKADTAMKVVPALHYIAVTAQLAPGKGGKHRLRMPFHQIDSVLNMAARINAIVFIDVQVGLSTLQQEIPELEKYLLMPQVHLGIDPEFSMKGGQAPGKVVGTFDAADINYTTEYLAKLVKENNLPPKVLVIHRFTKGMVTNYKQIKTRPEVQIVMDMDGWGPPSLKFNTYRQYIHKEPVQFTGFKIFYKNDTKNNSRLLTPEEVVALKPRPLYIQYQ